MQNLDESIGLARYAGPGAWNDLASGVVLGGPGRVGKKVPSLAQTVGQSWSSQETAALSPDRTAVRRTGGRPGTPSLCCKHLLLGLAAETDAEA